MTKTVTVIPGDGIGPEVTDATLKILRSALDSVVGSGEARTQDMGGGASTADFTAAVVRSLS
jgi:isocitrate/isopropylmalate dehydrogenase